MRSLIFTKKSPSPYTNLVVFVNHNNLSRQRATEKYLRAETISAKSVFLQTFAKMLFKVILSLLIIKVSAFSRIRESDSEGSLSRSVAHDKISPVVNRVEPICSGNSCTESEENGRIYSCLLNGCIKRAFQDDVGPFWANRGKKDPSYRSEPLIVDEPHWVLIRSSEDELLPYKNNFEPFFVTRGKKEKTYGRK
ncbi:hypothetical protein FQA39_LY11242 [Lamprigera yunnana]|nr:hypothetical protein FQA39_LY11242 [Lamprigera yunnana]